MDCESCIFWALGKWRDKGLLVKVKEVGLESSGSESGPSCKIPRQRAFRKGNLGLGWQSFLMVYYCRLDAEGLFPAMYCIVQETFCECSICL